mmetsp:Transcript_37006/g.60054  ORF Transcript_37006/g.60054 Transcript_37006/m.60054 type:complete len:152 (+) Transcript_37006:74-529(+)
MMMGESSNIFMEGPSHRFHGDGKYSGDGGEDLEKLWKAFAWKEIRGCPGRFISRNRRIRSLAPRAILAEASCGHDVAENKTCVARNKESSSSTLAPSPPPLTFFFNSMRKQGRDPMDIVLFETGGGLITYRKHIAGASEIATVEPEVVPLY